jgi:nucleotide-binding universal stress UspA family protein
MRTVLAAIDGSAASRAVLETAVGLGALLEATVEAIHVPEDGGDEAAAVAEHVGIPLRLVDGPVHTALLDALDAPEVIAAVVGARATPGGRRPVGRTAMRLLEEARRPVVVVPPEAVQTMARPLHTLLVPLEGSEASAGPVLADLLSLVGDRVELVVVHVFTDATVPAVLDHPEWELSLWGDEFLARFCPGATNIVLRTGEVGLGVCESCTNVGADLIVLSWSQDASAGHAAVVREVLGRATVPVLLLPIPGGASDG